MTKKIMIVTLALMIVAMAAPTSSAAVLGDQERCNGQVEQDCYYEDWDGTRQFCKTWTHLLGCIQGGTGSSGD